MINRLQIKIQTEHSDLSKASGLSASIIAINRIIAKIDATKGAKPSNSFKILVLIVINKSSKVFCAFPLIKSAIKVGSDFPLNISKSSVKLSISSNSKLSNTL